LLLFPQFTKVLDSRLRGNDGVQKVVDGRPSFAKPSFDDGKQEEIAVIDPDFE
jgi:hypothetical protein